MSTSVLEPVRGTGAASWGTTAGGGTVIWIWSPVLMTKSPIPRSPGASRAPEPPASRRRPEAVLPRVAPPRVPPAPQGACVVPAPAPMTPPQPGVPGARAWPPRPARPAWREHIVQAGKPGKGQLVLLLVQRRQIPTQRVGTDQRLHGRAAVAVQCAVAVARDLDHAPSTRTWWSYEKRSECASNGMACTG